MPAEPVRLSAVAERVGGCLNGLGDPLISDVTHDSRRTGPGFLFAALPGLEIDGRAFAGDAAARGSAAALVEGEFLPLALPQIKAPDARRALGKAAALVHGDPTLRLDVIGVTGTNGKTTVTLMIESIARAAGRPCGRLGTLGARLPGGGGPLALTTPESSDLQRLFAAMLERGAALAAVEVSSHAMALHRVEGTSFAVAAFTNLSQDHLDFHGTMEDYFAAKRALFDGRAAAHVIDVTDPPGRRLAEQAPGAVVTVGFGAGRDVGVTAAEVDLSGARFTCRAGGEEAEIRMGLGGVHNVRNAAVAVACARQTGIGMAEIAEGLEAVERIPGRLDPVAAGQPFTVLVDYAHTPAAVEAVVDAALEYCRGSVIVVVGGAGGRDPSKRPLLGAAAARAHLAVITSDNPRFEDPEALVAEVAAGAAGGRAEVVSEVDRRAAIGLALGRARPGDAVLILGKGHEQFQYLGGEAAPFDDRAVAASFLADGGARP